MTATRDQALAALASPVGEEGSGRVRYGGAMALYAAGQIGAEVLEVYRICSPLDSEDPRALLAARGLTLTMDLPTPTARIADLVAEADRYIATLSGPGVGEVRAGLRNAAPTLPAGTANPVVAAHLASALTALTSTHPALAAAIEGASPHLSWVTYDLYDRAKIGEAFATGHAYALLATGADYELGIFLVAPHILYRDHAHAATELYAPLTGPNGWRFGPGTALTTKPAHVPVWNPAHQPHATKVGPTPLLCLYGWTCDVTEPAYVIPADDWPAIEALRL
jgi:Dimethlysulfonioproprionate lyase